MEPPPKYEGSGSKISEKDLPEADELQEDFARELAKGMEDLMREMGAGTESSEADGNKELTQEEKEREKLFKAAWEAMLVDGMNGQGENLADLGDPLGNEGVKAKSTSSQPSGSGSGDKTDFQQTIKQAMEKLKQTESGLKVRAIVARLTYIHRIHALFLIVLYRLILLHLVNRTKDRTRPLNQYFHLWYRKTTKMIWLGC